MVPYLCFISTGLLKYCMKGSRCTGDLWRSRPRNKRMQISSWRGFFLDLCHLKLPIGTLGTGGHLKARKGMKYLTSLHVRSLWNISNEQELTSWGLVREQEAEYISFLSFWPWWNTYTQPWNHYNAAVYHLSISTQKLGPVRLLFTFPPQYWTFSFFYFYIYIHITFLYILDSYEHSGLESTLDGKNLLRLDFKRNCKARFSSCISSDGSSEGQ